MWQCGNDDVGLKMAHWPDLGAQYCCFMAKVIAANVGPPPESLFIQIYTSYAGA